MCSLVSAATRTSYPSGQWCHYGGGTHRCESYPSSSIIKKNLICFTARVPEHLGATSAARCERLARLTVCAERGWHGVAASITSPVVALLGDSGSVPLLSLKDRQWCGS